MKLSLIKQSLFLLLIAYIGFIYYTTLSWIPLIMSVILSIISLFIKDGKHFWFEKSLCRHCVFYCGEIFNFRLGVSVGINSELYLGFFMIGLEFSK